MLCRFKPSDGVICIAATNFPQSLDKALIRPGRFDRHVTVPNPDVKGRKEILEVHFKNVPAGKDVDLKVWHCISCHLSNSFQRCLLVEWLCTFSMVSCAFLSASILFTVTCKTCMASHATLPAHFGGVPRSELRESRSFCDAGHCKGHSRL